MNIEQVTNTGISTRSTEATQQPDPNRGVSSDFETFLRMLTVQMQNQDPLNPIESSDYAVQLATFSGVEQQVKTNDLLSSLAQQMSLMGMSQLSGWVGMEARAAAAVQFDGAPVTVYTKADADADAANLVVKDSQGTEVQRLNLDLSQPSVDWAGVADSGNPLPAGTYSFHVESKENGAVLGMEQAQVYQIVTEVKAGDSGTVVVLASGAEIPGDQVSGVRSPAG